MGDETAALNHLFQISVTERPDIYIKCCAYIYKVP